MWVQEDTTVERQAGKTFAHGENAPAEARRFARECLHAWHLAEMDVPILLAVSELTTNAVIHGSGPIDVAMDATTDLLRVTVSDDGTGVPARRRPDPRDAAVGGWGLQLVDAVADHWGTDNRHGRTSVWFDHALPPP